MRLENPRHKLKIKDLSLHVRLGCSPEERATPQEVRVQMELIFAEAPRAVQSDDLRETLCYARLSEVLQKHVQGREFQLVEKMAGDFYRLMQDFTEGRTQVSLTVHKVKPPVPGLLGGVEYSIGDFH